MSEIPNDFFSWKSFQSLTQTAAIAWVLILIIDAIFITGVQNEYTQIVWLWGIGFVICFVLASARLYYKEQKEKGDKLFLIFNAALIFLYASGFNGFTKELGSWSDLNKTLGKKDSLSYNNDQTNLFNINLASWIPSIFANQTSFFPDVKMIAENNELKSENKNLREKITKMKPIDISSYTQKIKELTNENEKLKEQVAKNGAVELSNFYSTIQTLQNDKAKLAYENGIQKENIDKLLNRIKDYNNLVSELIAIRKVSCISSGETLMLKNLEERCSHNYKYAVEYFSIISKLNPINTSLP